MRIKYIPILIFLIVSCKAVNENNISKETNNGKILTSCLKADVNPYLKEEILFNKRIDEAMQYIHDDLYRNFKGNKPGLYLESDYNGDYYNWAEFRKLHPELKNKKNKDLHNYQIYLEQHLRDTGKYSYINIYKNNYFLDSYHYKVWVQLRTDSILNFCISYKEKTIILNVDTYLFTYDSTEKIKYVEKGKINN